MSHKFIVENRGSDSSDSRVVQGVKQLWMGRIWTDLYTKVVVNCRLENLPRDIIGQNHNTEETLEQ